MAYHCCVLLMFPEITQFKEHITYHTLHGITIKINVFFNFLNDFFK